LGNQWQTDGQTMRARGKHLLVASNRELLQHGGYSPWAINGKPTAKAKAKRQEPIGGIKSGIVTTWWLFTLSRPLRPYITLNKHWADGQTMRRVESITNELRTKIKAVVEAMLSEENEADANAEGNLLAQS
jgi:hypothetical protein